MISCRISISRHAEKVFFDSSCQRAIAPLVLNVAGWCSSGLPLPQEPTKLGFLPLCHVSRPSQEPLGDSRPQAFFLCGFASSSGRGNASMVAPALLGLQRLGGDDSALRRFENPSRLCRH